MKPPSKKFQFCFLEIRQNFVRQNIVLIVPKQFVPSEFHDSIFFGKASFSLPLNV